MTTLPSALPTAALPVPTCGDLVAADGSTLPLTATRLRVRAGGGLARVQLVQTFANPHAAPLHVTYRLPLPADASVGGFAFRLGDTRIVGDVDRRAAARERFEKALAEGRTAALLEQERSSLFTQELGNLPPGAEVEATIDIDQPLAWQDDGWTWRFPTTAAPRYLGEAGRLADAPRQTVDVADPSCSTVSPRLELDLLIADTIVDAGEPASASHELCGNEGAGGIAVRFAEPGGRVMMDRDVVVSWPVATPQAGVSLQTVSLADGALAGQAFGLLTIVPPAPASRAPHCPRDLVVLLDISGSMHGAPLRQAQAVTAALIDSLTAHDRLELIAFASTAQHWRQGSLAATPQHKADALHWLRSLQAGGATEMHTAILAALAATRAEAQRQVVVVTDGLIGFEQEIVGAIRTSLPAASRVHVVGVGSAPNRTLTHGASRAGRGVELLIGVDEAADVAIARLLARTRAPLVTGLELTGPLLQAVAPAALPDLFAGAPVRIALRLDPRGGAVTVRGRGVDGAFEHTLELPTLGDGGDAAIHRTFAREAVEDLEAALAAGGNQAAVDAQIEALGLAHRISTRLTSWIALTDGRTVDPQKPAAREVVPHELPHGLSVAHLGLRGAPAPASGICFAVAAPAPGAGTASSISLDAGSVGEPAAKAAFPANRRRQRGLFDALFGRGRGRSADANPPTGKLRHRDDATWVLELSGLTTWCPPQRVVVTFADGSEHELRVDVAGTTAAQERVAAGAIVRLVLRADAACPPLVAVRLRVGGQGAIVEVAIG